MLTFLGVNEWDIDCGERVREALERICPDTIAVEGNERYVPLFYETASRYFRFMAYDFSAAFNLKQAEETRNYFLHLEKIHYHVFPWQEIQAYGNARRRFIDFLDTEGVAQRNLSSIVAEYEEFRRKSQLWSDEGEIHEFTDSLKNLVNESDDYSKRVYALCSYDLNALPHKGLEEEDMHDDIEFSIQCSRLLPEDHVHREQRLWHLVQRGGHVLCIVHFGQTLEDPAGKGRTLYSCVKDLNPEKFVVPYGEFKDE